MTMNKPNTPVSSAAPQLQAIITIGISASGKSTWAKQFVAEHPDWVIVCRDDIRASFQGGCLDWSKWNWKNEDKVTVNHSLALRQARDQEKNIVVADTNLNPRFLVELQNKLKALGYEVGIKVFEVDVDEANRRDKARGALMVGPNVIQKQIDAFNKLKSLGMI